MKQKILFYFLIPNYVNISIMIIAVFDSFKMTELIATVSLLYGSTEYSLWANRICVELVQSVEQWLSFSNLLL